MIDRTVAAGPPRFRRQSQSLQFVATRPPPVPQFADITSSGFFVNRQIARIQKTGNAEKDSFNVVRSLAERFQRESLGDECEWQFVLLVAECRRNLLKQRFIERMVVDFRPNA